MEKKKKAKFTWKNLLEIVTLPIWVFLVFIVTEYSVSYGSLFLLGREQLSEPVWLTVLNAVIYSLTFFLIAYLPVKLFKRWKTSREELGLKELPTWTDLGLAPVGFFVYLILAMILTYVAGALFPGFDISEAQETGYEFLNSGLDRIVAFLALVIIAPIAEEIIFRGWLYGKLRAKIPGKFSLFLSVLIVSVLFGILHGQWNVGINVFAMSIVLCTLREITGTVYSGILLHILKNGVAFVMLYILNFGF